MEYLRNLKKSSTESGLDRVDKARGEAASTASRATSSAEVHLEVEEEEEEAVEEGKEAGIMEEKVETTVVLECRDTHCDCRFVTC